MAVETLRPSAPGDVCALSIESGAACDDHYLNVDETIKDDDTTFVAENIFVYQLDLYNIDDSGVGVGTINKVTVYVYCKYESGTADQPSLKITIKTGGTAYEGNEETLTTSYALYSKEWANNPGGGAWSWAQVDALQVGISLREAHSSTGKISKCTQIYVEVDYSPAGPVEQAVGDGTITPASTLGILTKVTRGLGTITPTGALTAILKIFKTVGEGTITPTGTLASIFKYPKAVGNGTITPASTLELLIKKAIGDGIITPAGVLNRLTKTNVGNGTITPAGVLAGLLKINVGDGTITPTGTLTSILGFLQAVGDGTITPTGVLTRVVSPLFGAKIIRIAFDTDPMDAVPIWTDVSADVLSLYIKTGRQHELNRIETGIANIKLLNVDGNYWPLNAGGDYYPKVLPGKKINIRAIFDGTIYDLYTGFIESWEPGWMEGQIAVANVTCTDIIKRFSRHDMNNAGEAQELSGARIGNVLDEIGWPAADRDLDTGQTTLKATGAQNPVNAMTHLFLVQDTEVGIIFLAPNGNIIFQDRHARLKSPYTVSQAIFGEDGAELGYRMIEPSYDDQFIFNDIRRTRDGGAEQTASDATSQTAYGKSTNNKTGLLMLLDTEAKDQCDYMLRQYKDPRFRMRRMELIPEKDPVNLFPKALGYAISTRITLRNNESSLDEDFHIEGKIHSFDGKSDKPWMTWWQLSNADGAAYWAIGVAGFSEIGETTYLAY